LPLGFANLYSCVTTRGVFTSWKKVAQMTRERGPGDPFLSKTVASVGHLHLILTLQLAPFVADLAIIRISGFVLACFAICLILDLAPNLNVTIMPVLHVTLQHALALLHSFLRLSLFKPFRITHTMLVAGR
jgi:hypothetical protein